MFYYLGVLMLAMSTLFASSNNERAIERGERLFADNCASCHVGRMEAFSDSFRVNPRDLTLSLLDQEQMIATVKKGTQFYGSATDYMIGYEGIYSDDEIRDIIAYVHKELNTGNKKANRLYAEALPISSEKTEEEVFEEGRKVYLRRCIHCHGPHGKGDGIAVKASMGNLFPYDLTKTLLTDEQKFLFIKYGSKEWGTERDDMPAWGRVYDDHSIHSVVNYINHIKKVNATANK